MLVVVFNESKDHSEHCAQEIGSQLEASDKSFGE